MRTKGALIRRGGFVRTTLDAGTPTMGTLIDLDTHRRARRASRPESAPARAGSLGVRSAHAPLSFTFDVVSPFTYLAAERIERLFPGASWCAADPGLSTPEVWEPEARRLAEARAAALRMPLLWPEERTVPRTIEPDRGRAARRASAHAASRGRGAAFVTAAGRLAFCGGFDLDTPHVIAEAAMAARLSVEECLRAARDEAWDEPLARAAERVTPLGVLPVLECGERVFAGEQRLSEAVAAAAALAN